MSDINSMDIPLWTLEDIEELQELVGRVRQLTYDYPGVLARTLNRVAAGARTDALNMVKEGYALLPADVKRVRKRFFIRRATWQKPVAYLWAKDRHGTHVSERQPYAAWEGIKFSVLASQKNPHGRALLPPGAFIGRGAHSEKVIVFRRSRHKFVTYTGKRGVHKRPVIKAVYTTSEMTFLRGQGQPELREKVLARLAKDGRSELEYVLERVFDKKWGVKRDKA